MIKGFFRARAPSFPQLSLCSARPSSAASIRTDRRGSFKHGRYPKSYFVIERGVAGKQLRDAWKEHPIASPIKHEKAVIEPYRNLPGYGWWWVCPNSPFIDSLD